MTFFGRNGHFVGVWKENKHGDPQSFFHFLIDNDNMYNTLWKDQTIWTFASAGKNSDLLRVPLLAAMFDVNWKNLKFY